MLYVHEKKRPKEKKFQCAICDYIATCDWNLNDHVKRVHHKIKEHCCDKCGKRFSSVQYLKKHDFKNHGGVNGGRIYYKCDICIGGKSFRGPGILEKHYRLIHKIEGLINVKPEGFDEKMAQQAKKFWQQWKPSIPPKYEDIDENSEKILSPNLPSLVDTILPETIGSGALDSSVIQTNINEDEDYTSTKDYVIDVEESMNEHYFEESKIQYKIEEQSNMQVTVEQKINNKNLMKTLLVQDEIFDQEDKNYDEQNPDEQESSPNDAEYSNLEKDLLKEFFPSKVMTMRDFTENDENQCMDNEDFENSNHIEEVELLSASKMKHKEVDIDYDTYYEAYSSNINGENEDSKTDEKVYEKINIGLQSQKVPVELEESDKVEQNTDGTPDQQEWDQNFKMKTNGIEIKIEKNEVIKNRFGQVVDKKIKCIFCHKLFLGKWAAKSLQSHCRLVHEVPKLKEAKKEVTKDDYDISVQKCKFCNKSYVGLNALKSMKVHMKSHSSHHNCHICDKNFLHKLGSLVWHLQIKHRCVNVCEKCECKPILYLYPNYIVFSTFSLFILGGKAFTSKEFLKTHSNRKHNDQRIKSRDDGIFECKICNRELKRYGHAERHMKLSHPSEESTCLNFEDSQVCVLITM